MDDDKSKVPTLDKTLLGQAASLVKQINGAAAKVAEYTLKGDQSSAALVPFAILAYIKHGETDKAYRLATDLTMNIANSNTMRGINATVRPGAGIYGTAYKPDASDAENLKAIQSAMLGLSLAKIKEACRAENKRTKTANTPETKPFQPGAQTPDQAVISAPRDTSVGTSNDMGERQDTSTRLSVKVQHAIDFLVENIGEVTADQIKALSDAYLALTADKVRAAA